MTFNNDKFKTVLSNDLLKDPEFVKDYLAFSFYKRKPEKDPKLYINICRIYEVYPDTIKEVLDNINKLGYYKDYFHILKHTNPNSTLQKELITYIYELIIKQISEDITNMKKKGKISTLGKYLPREKSKVNIKINFIDRFNEVMFPKVSQFTARKNYRRLKTEFNNYLGTLESKLATKQYDKINFDKVSHYALSNNMNVIENHEAAAQKFKDYRSGQLKTGSLTYFVSCVLSHEYEEEEIEKVWDYNRFLMDIPGLSYELVANSAVILDLSKDTFGFKFEYFTIGLALLVHQFSLLEKKVFLAGHGYIDFVDQKTITQKCDYLMKLCGPTKEILVNNYLELVQKENPNVPCKNLVFSTSKYIGNIEEVMKDTKVTLRQYIPDYGKYYIIYYNGNQIKKYCRYNHKDHGPQNDENKEKKITNIGQITKKSKELNDFRGPVYVLMFISLLLVATKVWEIYY